MTTSYPSSIKVGGLTFVRASTPYEFDVSELTLELLQSLGTYMNIHTNNKAALGLNVSIGYLFTPSADLRMKQVSDEPYWKQAFEELNKIKTKLSAAYLKWKKDCEDALAAGRMPEALQVAFTIGGGKAHTKNVQKATSGLNPEFTKLHEKGHSISLAWFKHDKLNKVKRHVDGVVSQAIRELCKPYALEYEMIYRKVHAQGTNYNLLAEFLADYYAISGFYFKNPDHRAYVDTEIATSRRPYFKAIVDSIIQKFVTWDRLQKVVLRTLREYEEKLEEVAEEAKKSKKTEITMTKKGPKKEKGPIRLKRPKY